MNSSAKAVIFFSSFLISLGALNHEKITEKVKKMDDKQKTITAVTVASSFGILTSAVLYLLRKSHKQ